MWLGNWYDGSPINVIDTCCWGVGSGVKVRLGR